MRDTHTDAQEDNGKGFEISEEKCSFRERGRLKLELKSISATVETISGGLIWENSSFIDFQRKCVVYFHFDKNEALECPCNYSLISIIEYSINDHQVRARPFSNSSPLRC